MTRRQAGFTLSETLAVIVILAALAALLFPAFSASRKSSYGVVCVSNLHQLGVASLLYAEAHEDHLPVVVNAIARFAPEVRYGRGATDDPFAHPSIRTVLTAYVKGEEVWHCPVDYGTLFGRRSFPAFPKFHRFNDGTSYLVAELFDGQTASSWRDPSGSLWMCDGATSWHAPDYDPWNCQSHRVNGLAYDGHVRSVVCRNAPTFLE